MGGARLPLWSASTCGATFEDGFRICIWASEELPQIDLETLECLKGDIEAYKLPLLPISFHQESLFQDDERQDSQGGEESARLVEKSKAFETRLSRCDLLLQHVEYLMKYEELGIMPFEPAPSVALEEYQHRRCEIVMDEAARIVQQAENKRSKLKTMRAMKNAVTTAQDKIAQLAADHPDLSRDIAEYSELLDMGLANLAIIEEATKQ